MHQRSTKHQRSTTHQQSTNQQRSNNEARINNEATTNHESSLKHQRSSNKARSTNASRTLTPCMQPLSTQALAIVPIDRQSLDTAVPSHQPAMTDATISFLDGTSVKAKADLTVREVRKALTPRNKLYAHLDLCYKTNVLGGDETVGSRHLQGVWRRVKEAKELERQRKKDRLRALRV